MQLRGPNVYIYVVDRDFGFAPNPFHGFCTLSCCKPKIRSVAEVDDWIFGVGGSSLKASGRCIFGMRVTETLSFDDYWADPRFEAKKPVWNGSRAMMLGDNIYHRDNAASPWQQEDSHHSRPDGTPDPSNIANDTQKNKMLISDHFVYFGDQALKVPESIFSSMSYINGRGHRKFSEVEAEPLTDWFKAVTQGRIGEVLGDPFQFRQSAARYSSGSNKIIMEVVEPLRP